MQDYEANRGKKPVKYTYTLKDIADLTGYSIHYIYKCKQQAKILDFSKLKDVIAFVEYRRRIPKGISLILDHDFVPETP